MGVNSLDSSNHSLPDIIRIVNWRAGKSSFRVGTVLLIVFFGYLSIHPFMTAFIGSLTESYASIKIWKDILVGIIATVAAIYSLANAHVREKILKDRLVWLIVAYVGYTFLIFVLSRGYSDESGYAGLIFNLRFVALFFVIRVFMLRVAGARAQMQVCFDLLVKSVIVIGVSVASFGVVQTLILPDSSMSKLGYDGVNTISPVSTVDDNIDTPRAFSTLWGPNEFGAFLIIPILLCVERFLRSKRWQYGVGTLIMIAGLYLSHSRSALLGLIVALAVFAAMWLYGKFGKQAIVLSILGVAVLPVVALSVAMNYEPARIVVFHSSAGDDSLIEGSTFDHFNATLQGVNDVLKYPHGRGVGEAGPASFYQTDGDHPRIAENYYIQIAQEVGIVGLLLFISIVVVGLRRVGRMKGVPYSQSFLAGFVGLSVVAFFLHTWTDDPVAYIAWGLFAVVLGIIPRESTAMNVKKEEYSRN